MAPEGAEAGMATALDKTRSALRRIKKERATKGGQAAIDVAIAILDDPGAHGIAETASAASEARQWARYALDLDKAAADGDIAAMVKQMERKKKGSKALDKAKSGKLHAVG